MAGNRAPPGALPVRPDRYPAPGRPLPSFRDGCVAPRGLPILDQPVPAGFPSPAADFAEERLCIEDHLVEHREATFYVRVSGHSMNDFGIHDGDLLVVDKAVTPADGAVVVAVVDGQFAVKQLRLLRDGVLLRSGNAGSQDILVGAEQALSIWGVVRWSIHRV
jgi:DNA polymerase V